MKIIYGILLLTLLTVGLCAQQKEKTIALPADFAAKEEQANEMIRDGNYEGARTALIELENSLPENFPEQKAMLLTTHGSLYLNTGRNDLALESLQKALSIWETLGKVQTLDAARTQSVLGNLYRATGKYAQAEEQLNMALMVRQNLLKPKDERIAASLNDLGLVYTFSDVDKALDHYEQALKIYVENHGKTDPKIAIAKSNIAYLYARLELFGDAINNFEEALAIWDQVYKSAHPAKGFVLFSLGSTYEKMKNLKAARGYYERASKVYQESYQGKHPDIARVYNAIGNLDRAENKFGPALQNFQKALQANHANFNSESVTDNPSVKQSYDGNVLLYSLMYKAQALESSYFNRTLRFKDLLLAIRTLESCDTLIDRLRHQIINESDKITLGTIADEVFADGVRICTEAAHAAWNKKTYFEKAFFFAEKSKAAVLLGAISDSNAKSFGGIPSSLLEEEKQLKSAIALCTQKLAQKPSDEEERYLRQTFYELNRNYESFGQRLEKEFPAYYNLKYNSSSPSIAQLQKKLSPHTLVVSYFTDDKNNRLYRFRISKTGFAVEDLPLPTEFDRLVTGLKNGVYFSEIKTYQKAAEQLSPLLIPAKIPRSVSDLVIIPASRISTLPFETLFTRKTRVDDTYQTLPYLIRSYSVRYEFSSGLVLQKGSANVMTPSILLCAPITFEGDATLPDLPGTENEVNEISSLFKQKKYASKLFVGPMADEKNIKEEDLKSFSFLHFATHGVVDAVNPELSRIFLKSGAASEDGNLYSGEIYNLQLNADLVTLSACQTGLGKISKGEGVIGLSRALIYAGARNCMVSFWKVSDQSTATLMKDYYVTLLNHPSRNLTATLQAAKKKMIESEQYSAPFYWAPFILIGF